MSKVVRLTRDVGLAILGADALLSGPEAATTGVVQEMALFSPAPSIYGGTDEIQRNIIGERVLGLGERVLGLPREPGNDAVVSFRELKRSPQRS